MTDPTTAYWRELAERNDAQVAAACRAAGAAGFYLGPYFHSSDAERLALLRDVIAELRHALNLDDPDTTPNLPRQNGRDS